MARWNRFVSRAGGKRIISGLGGLFVALGAGRALFVLVAGWSIVGALIEFVVIGIPGLGLLFGSYQLSRSGIHPDVHPRVVAWCLGGAGVMLGVVVLLTVNPAGSVNRPLRAAAIAGGLGAIGGLGIGIQNAQAHTRAYEAERHRDELRQERDLRERIVETSPIGIGVVNVDGSIRMVNEHAADIVGIPRDEILDLRYDEPMFREPGTADDSTFKRILSTEEPVYGEEQEITRADGEHIWLSVNGVPLRDSSGGLSGVVFAFEDITERKQLEQELKETIGRLERSNDQLRQFTYAASHDLQEPLRMVSSYLQLLENRYERELDEEAREFIDFAVDGADRMREMVEALLTYSRIEESDPTFEPTDCDAVVEQVLTNLQVQLEETNAEIITEPLPTLEADESQLKQLFQNLISNALKYNDGTPRVEVAAEQRNGHWEFTVADNGIGIAPEHIGQVFEVFQRLHHDDEYSGTGVGLSLCQRIVENHDGEIWVESEPGEGSTFYVSLPRRKQPDDTNSHRERDRYPAPGR